MSVYVGIDWSEKKHDVVFINESGAIIGQVTLKHTAVGLSQLEKVREKLGFKPAECVVGLETAHNLVIDYLWASGYPQIYVTPPGVIKSCRGRYGQSGARDDRRDGRLIADVVRTDRARLYPWKPDSLLTRQIRAKISLVGHLTGAIVRQTNRLRAVLLGYYPAAVVVFSRLAGTISLQFVQQYPTPAAATALSYEEFVAFAKGAGYPRPGQLRSCFARLQANPWAVSPEIVLMYQAEAELLAASLEAAVQAKKQVLREVQRLFKQHPGQAVFSSLPGAGSYLAPALLSKFGDDRQRFPTPANLQALAGTCPVTDQSGKHRVIRFRRACDREFRQICQQWARESVSQSVWANAYWQDVRPRCGSDNHAYRCLANRWLAVAWKLWQTDQPYDESYHLQQRAQRATGRS